MRACLAKRLDRREARRTLIGRQVAEVGQDDEGHEHQPADPVDHRRHMQGARDCGPLGHAWLGSIGRRKPSKF